MEMILTNLLQISVIMSIVIVGAILIEKLLSNKIPPKSMYYVWIIIAISLLIPFRPNVVEPIATYETPFEEEGITHTISTVNETSSQEPVNTTVADRFAEVSLGEILLVVWLVGVAAFLLFHLVKHLRFVRVLKRWSTPLSDTSTLQMIDEIKNELGIKADIIAFNSKIVSIPMMVGILKPKLVIPSYHIDDEELGFIIKHELIHYKRFDMLIKLIAIIANALHWFNPFVYVMQRRLQVNCEVACDYDVIKESEKSERIKYGETIIGIAQNHLEYKTAFSTNFCGGKKTMKKRLESILADNKMRSILAIIVIGAVIVLSISASTAIAAQNDESAIDNKVVSEANYISQTEAEKIALNKTNGGEIVKSVLDTEDGQREYEIDIVKKNKKYDLTINAKTGEITEYEVEKIKNTDNASPVDSSKPSDNSDQQPAQSNNSEQSSNRESSSNNSSNNISESKAREIALNKTGGGSIVEFELDYDDGIAKYEIQIIKGGYEYDIDINAKNGKIISFDKEPLDDDDR